MLYVIGNPLIADESFSEKKADIFSGWEIIPVIEGDTIIKKSQIEKVQIKDTLIKYSDPVFTAIDTNDFKLGYDTLPYKLKGSSVKENFQDRKKSSSNQKIPSGSMLNVKAVEKTFHKYDPKQILVNQMNSLKPQGSVSVGYDYGVLPYVAGTNQLSGGYKTEGNLSFLILKVPLELTFYYTEIKNTIGLSNYFRISYDANRYKNQLAEKLNVKDKLSYEKLGKLQVEQQSTLQKMEYLNFLKQNPDYKLPLDGYSENKYGIKSDSGIKNDSIAAFLSSYKNSNYQQSSTAVSKSDSLKKQHENSEKRDSINREFSNYKSKYDSINKEINNVKEEIDQIKKMKDNPGLITNPYLSRFQQFLSCVKKFEIGLCNPSYSTFLVNNIPLQGINAEFSKNNNFFAFTYGTTVNNLLYNTNTVEGKIQGIRNTYNYFDFGNLSAGRKILSVKGGVGAKEESHFYVGILVGKGRADYLLPTLDPYSSTLESNVVMELDFKYKFSKDLSIDVVMGKSSVKDEDLTSEQVKKSINEIFSGFRSYALMARLNFYSKKTNTKFTFTTRWIDPYFKSFGIGFLRSDNLRFEIKADQPITKKIRYTIAYRREEDNILKLYDFKNTLQSINNSVNIKLNRQFNLRLNYNPLFRELSSSSSIIKDRNFISTVILSYIPKAKKISSQFNALYSKYSISGDSSKISFENFTYTHQLQFKSGFKTGFNASWFKNSLKDTVNNDTYLGVIDIGYLSKGNSSFSIGGKMSYKKDLALQYGFVLKASVKIYKGLFWEANAEKILIGDYYNSFITDQIKQFPYYCSTKLVLNL